MTLNGKFNIGKKIQNKSLSICFGSIHFLLVTIMFFMMPGNFAYGEELGEKTFFVSVSGSDTYPGTQKQPFATLEAARDAARKVGPGNKKIVVLAGEYYLKRPLELGWRDNGLTIEADGNGKAVLYGGVLLANWKPEGDKFWYVDLPEVKGGTWDFRALVVNGKLPERARMPESGTLIHRQSWDVKVLPAIAGYWERQPEPEEKLVMAYDPKDIPKNLDINNAEVRVYHMWNESFVGVARNDVDRHELIFSSPTTYPPGAFGVKKYVIWNTREGMTKPGRWYVDRTAGRLVYWPLEGEDMSTAKIIAPKMEHIIRIAGDGDRKAENIAIKGLVLQATTIPLKSAGFGGRAFDGAITMTNSRGCVIEGVDISNVGGLGIVATDVEGCSITDSHIYNTGAACLTVRGEDIFLARNHIHDAGLYYPSSAAMGVSGTRIHIYRNEIHDAPYSGMIVGRNEILVEENLIYRVMTQVHDGAAVYVNGGNRTTLRGNIVRDVSASGQGYGVSAFYLDEGANECIVEHNVSIGVARPTHNHIARNTIVRDNVFISDEDMTLSFQSSSNFTFERNTIMTPGNVRITSPNAVRIWRDNRIFSNGRESENVLRAFSIDSAIPYVPVPPRKTALVEVARSSTAPVLDGQLSNDEWPGSFYRLDRQLSRRGYSGAPVMLKFSWDKKYIYIAGMMSMFDNSNISMGDTWGEHDGIEISIGGFDKGKPVTFVVRSYVNGTVQSITDAGATAVAASRLGEAVQFVPKTLESGKGWIGEWAIPLDALGLRPKGEMKIPFNACGYVNEYDNWHCWEGTLGMSWNIGQGGTLLFK
jgi:hypothetical protein